MILYGMRGYVGMCRACERACGHVQRGHGRALTKEYTNLV